MSIDNLWTAGGIVSIPLLGFSLMAIALIIERIIFWWRVKQNQRRIVKEVLSLYRSDRFAAISKLKQNAQLPIARIFLEVMGLVVAIFTLPFANTFRGLYLRELAFIQEYGGQLELFNRRFHQGVRKYATHQ